MKTKKNKKSKEKNLEVCSDFLIFFFIISDFSSFEPPPPHENPPNWSIYMKSPRSSLFLREIYQNNFQNRKLPKTFH